MPVQFKFRGEKAFRTLLNVTTPCTLGRVKTAIYEQARISDTTTDLALEGVSSGPLDPKSLLVQDALVQVIVRRTPVQSRPIAAPSLVLDDEDDMVGAPNASDVLMVEEDLAIDRVVDQHDVGAMGMSASSSGNALLRYSRSYRLAIGGVKKKKDGYDLGASDDEDEEEMEPPPKDYTCHRCGQVAQHWIWDCPTNDDPDHVRKVRSAKGVPRDFLRKVASVEEGQEQSAGGVTFTLPGHSGTYIMAHESTFQDKKKRLGDTVQDKVTAAFTDGAKGLETSLKCPLCNQMFRQAILAPCCGATFCSDCVVDRLAAASLDNSSCPGCGKEVYAHQLVANEDIRTQVEQISRATKAVALAANKEERPSDPRLASLKDRVNRPRKAGDGAEAAPVLALMDSSGGAEAQPGGSAPVAPPSAPGWQPLGFGPFFAGPEQLVAWQRLVRAGVPPQARQEFEEWQTKMREHFPHAGSPPVPSKESFEELKRKMREERASAAQSSAPPA